MKLSDLIQKHQKVPVKHYPHQVEEKPMVSVCVQTYQHVGFIKQCLDGILMQETTFPFEILLGEDESTDGTREICIEYAQKYPNKIRLFLHSRENNLKFNGQSSGRFNFIYCLSQAKGKYIALCEGDDYWIDTHKLQKQVDYLEHKKSYSFVAARVNIKEGSFIHERKRSANFRNHFDFKYLAQNWYLNTCTFVFKREIGERMSFLSTLSVADKYVALFSLQFGRGYVFDEVMGVYRLHPGGISKNDITERSAAWNILKDMIIFKRYISNDLHENYEAAVAYQYLYFQFVSYKSIKSILAIICFIILHSSGKSTKLKSILLKLNF